MRNVHVGTAETYPDGTDYVHWLRLQEWDDQGFVDDVQDQNRGVCATPLRGVWATPPPPDNRPWDVSGGVQR